jgi:hypothetical protein
MAFFHFIGLDSRQATLDQYKNDVKKIVLLIFIASLFIFEVVSFKKVKSKNHFNPSAWMLNFTWRTVTESPSSLQSVTALRFLLPLHC